MFSFLSKLRRPVLPARDQATIEKAINDLFEMAGKMQTSINRIERKVYRDQAAGNGSDQEAAEAVFQAQGPVPGPGPGLDQFSAGDQLPPHIIF